MKKFLHSRVFYIFTALIIIGVVILMMYKVSSNSDNDLVTTAVGIGPVLQIVSVSGIAESEQTAQLAFPAGGIVDEVFVKVGDVVEAGDTLITLDSRALAADRLEAVAAVSRAVADRDELLQGPTDSAREVTSETLKSKLQSLETTKINEKQKVSNAYHSLLSSNLAAYSDNPNEDSVPPTISGTYSCNQEGTYTLAVFSSGTNSGYSYRLTGIETGTYVASTDQPIAIGDCGLRIIFDEDSRYARTIWTIEIPNTKSSLYVTSRNTYALTVTQAASAITLAEQEVVLAQAAATNQNAPARSEAITRANAAITQAQARLVRIDTTITDKSLEAPFAGTITSIDMLPGETVTTAPMITLLADSYFEVTARIPEIDIGKLLAGQSVKMIFDARQTEEVSGEISFISPQATKIDGVSYYEAIIQFQEIPTWIRSGLNADIEIITAEADEGLRVLRRFVTTTPDGHTVNILSEGTITTKQVDVVLEGNNGFFAIIGVTEGDVLVTP